MNKKIVIVCVIGGILLLFGSGLLGWYVGKKTNKPVVNNKPTITIKDEKPTTWSVIKEPNLTNEDIEKWKKTPLIILGEMIEQDTLRIKTTDGYKKAEKDFILNCKTPDKKNVIIFSIVGGLPYKEMTWEYGGIFSYYRFLFSKWGLGGGITITNRNILLNTGIIVKF